MTDALSRTQVFEGTRLKPYVDCCSSQWRACTCAVKGILTIGSGCNLDEGISAVESYFLFSNRMAAAKLDLNREIPWAAGQLSDARYAVLWDMAYNLGIGRLLGFKRMLAAIRTENWQAAHDEMLFSDVQTGALTPYRLQVGDRAEKNANVLLSGEWA